MLLLGGAQTKGLVPLVKRDSTKNLEKTSKTMTIQPSQLRHGSQ